MEPLPFDVISDPDAVRQLLNPLRRRLLAALAEPASAAELARSLDLPRQRIGYHLRELERSGLIVLVELRRKRNCEERILQTRARTFVVSPSEFSAVGETSGPPGDRFSWSRLASMAAGVVRDLAALRSQEGDSGARLQTLAEAFEIRFASIGHQLAFVQELTDELARLRRKYDRKPAAGTRAVRVFLGAYPEQEDSVTARNAPRHEDGP